jgi:hypothetical protein
LNALLYDPAKDVNTRFSVMANTSVARLYHSEAILLADGRVMVSGSDPQDGDGVHSEEYFLSGLPQPTFNLSNTDWGYGESVTFNITSNSMASTNEIKISLLGAVVSTHANSIGQRNYLPRIFLQFYDQRQIRKLNFEQYRRLFQPFRWQRHKNFTSPCNFTGNLSSTSNFTSNSNSTDPGIDDATLAETVIQCTVTAPPNAHICPSGWFLMFILDGPTPTVGTFIRIGGDPADLGNWPASADFDVPGI